MAREQLPRCCHIHIRRSHPLLLPFSPAMPSIQSNIHCHATGWKNWYIMISGQKQSALLPCCWYISDLLPIFEKNQPSKMSPSLFALEFADTHYFIKISPIFSDIFVLAYNLGCSSWNALNPIQLCPTKAILTQSWFQMLD